MYPSATLFQSCDMVAVNKDAAAVGAEELYSVDVRELPKYNGRRFFSQCLDEQCTRAMSVDPHHNNDQC